VAESVVDKKIYESASTLVRRTTWHEQPVVTKTLKPHAQTPNAIARYHHEFNINQSLTSPYVCRALAMLRDKHLENPWKKHDNIPL